MSRRSHVRDALAIGLGVAVFGMAFGVLTIQAGGTVWHAMALSLLTFTGGSQFALAGVIQAGGSVATALTGAILLALRNGVYGLALSSTITGGLGRRMLAAHFVIDESTAMAIAQPDPEQAQSAFWTTGLSLFVFWNVGTVIGALGGNVLGDPAGVGLDVAFPAGFLALMGPALRTRAGAIAAAVGAAIALVALPTTSPGVPVLLAAAGAFVAHVLTRDSGAP